MLARILFVCVMFFQLPVATVAAQAAEQWEAGKHYKVLPYPVRTRNADKVEVVELFWYGCPHCYTLNPVVHHWAKQQADDVDFWLSPAVFGGTWKTHAQAFYTAEVLGIGNKMHQPLFDAIVRDRKKLNNEASLAEFFSKFGVDKKKFKKAFNSFAVSTRLQQADSRGRSYRATEVPALVVNGKYLVSSRLAGGREKMFEVVDHLVNKERNAQK
ncbi:MAG: disulfide bond formation protein DsbA [Proteobacteria bacterium]|nr:MAG: disulfide bond formation protein DsbA [Pseudomonadota bacterium]